MTPETPLAELLTRAIQHHQAGALDAAEAGYRAVLARHAEHPDALHLIGLIMQARENLTTAEANIRHAIELRPGEAVFHYNLANVLRDAGRPDEAIDEYRAALAQQPGDPDTLLNLGATLHSCDRLPEAAAVIRDLLKQDPQHLGALLNLGQILRSLGDVAGAAQAYTQVLTLDPQQAEAHVNLGALRQDAGAVEAALRHYEAAVAADPESAPAWNNFGTWYQERGDHTTARDCYRRALACDPQDAAAHNNLGTLLVDDDRLPEAVACYQAAIDCRPDFAEAHKNLGAVLQRLGQRAAALASYREALRLRPAYAEAAFKLAALAGELSPASAPAEYVADLFDHYARNYDRHLRETLRYQVPEALVALLAEAEPRTDLSALDLGCGTGLSGEALRALTRERVGVDLSPRMLARARERGLYARLVQGDIATALHSESASYDLVMAADVFVYIGDLVPVLTGVQRVLRAGGWMAFSVETGEGDSYHLQPTGRFAHAPAYVEAQCRAVGLIEHARRTVTLRLEHGQPVAGQLWLWKSGT